MKTKVLNSIINVLLASEMLALAALTYIVLVTH